MAWTIGEYLAEMPGREWCAGILAVSAIPMYRIHVLHWIGAMLRENGPTSDMKALWPLLHNLAAQPAYSARPLPALKWSSSQRKLCARAWNHRGSGDRGAKRTPAIIASAINLRLSLGNTGDLSANLAETHMSDALDAWFDMLDRHWDELGDSFK
jgi:hypothetical protein